MPKHDKLAGYQRGRDLVHGEGAESGKHKPMMAVVMLARMGIGVTIAQSKITSGIRTSYASARGVQVDSRRTRKRQQLANMLEIHSCVRKDRSWTLTRRP